MLDEAHHQAFHRPVVHDEGVGGWHGGKLDRRSVRQLGFLHAERTIAWAWQKPQYPGEPGGGVEQAQPRGAGDDAARQRRQRPFVREFQLTQLHRRRPKYRLEERGEQPRLGEEARDAGASVGGRDHADALPSDPSSIRQVLDVAHHDPAHRMRDGHHLSPLSDRLPDGLRGDLGQLGQPVPLAGVANDVAFQAGACLHMAGESLHGARPPRQAMQEDDLQRTQTRRFVPHIDNALGGWSTCRHALPYLRASWSACWRL
mmetsp:Transcript_44580/g.113924  ORF Transcript_44580/g.113924 Transcript_44580/m.113924 type:complete len:259 (-) Transcript_44580:238-1014(-)